MVHKGKVSTILDDGKAITATPYAGGTVSAPLTVPFFLVGALPVGTPIAYVAFADNTGVVLSRMDGEWNHMFDGPDQPEQAAFFAVVENGVCTVGCDGSAAVQTTITGAVCVVSCDGTSGVTATVEGGVCTVKCQ